MLKTQTLTYHAEAKKIPATELNFLFLIKTATTTPNKEESAPIMSCNTSNFKGGTVKVIQTIRRLIKATEKVFKI